MPLTDLTGTLEARDGACLLLHVEGRSLRIRHPGLWDLLLESVPVWIGGDALYLDNARLAGDLDAEIGEVSNLTMLVIERSGQEFQVPLRVHASAPLVGERSPTTSSLQPAQRASLDALLDGLDRLYDQECGVEHVHALLVAAHTALAGHPLAIAISEAATALHRIQRSGASRDEQNAGGLAATDALRRQVAEVLGE